ncbi:hypothetical protein Asp14428_59750 [Actinoplanes sp. NBRC 14428]|nr:hypothetical protein Asp14428_59750 [Actinoplanes sp. NBRC 14428]
MAVHLTRIYTRTGDAGSTRLGNNEVAAKTDPRIVAYADVDECNAALGWRSPSAPSHRTSAAS